MEKYIDRDAFVEKHRKLYCENCDRRKGMKMKSGKMRYCYEIGDAPCRACDIGDMLDAVEDFPAADVRENRRARWKCSSIGCWYCSKCNEEPYYSGDIHRYRFCPYCGAAMGDEK